MQTAKITLLEATPVFLKIVHYNEVTTHVTKNMQGMHMLLEDARNTKDV